MTQFAELLKILSQNGADIIVVGGIAAAAHGALRTTLDLDLVYSRSAANLARIVTALTPYSPYPRGAPAGLPFLWDVKTLKFGSNFTLTTTLGQIDLLGEIAGGGTFENLISHTIRLEILGTTCLCIDLENLIKAKRAAGRPKDFEAMAELESLREKLKPAD